MKNWFSDLHPLTRHLIGLVINAAILVGAAPYLPQGTAAAIGAAAQHAVEGG